MSDLNQPSGKKRKRSSDHSDRDLDLRLEHSVKPSESRSSNKLPVPLQPTASLEPPTANQEADQVSYVEAWISDPQQPSHDIHQTPDSSESAINPDSQKQSLVSGTASTPTPLTEQNLKLLRQQTMSADLEHDAGPSTTSKSPVKSASTTASKTIFATRLLFAINGMHFEEPRAARLKYPKVIQKVERLLGDRDSEKKRTTTELANAFEDYRHSNEMTLQANIMPLLKGTERTVTQQVAGKEPTTVRNAWRMNGLGENWTHSLAAGAVPVLKPGPTFEKELFEEILKKHPKIKDPAPDVLYGSWDKAFSNEERAVNLMFSEFSCISEQVYHAAFVWEWKSARGSLEEAFHQACRGAAAVGYAMREFRKCVGEDISKSMVDGVDLESLVFAMCIDNKNAYMYVGFYTEEGGSINFRFFPARDYAFFMHEEALGNLRKDVHNVLDWICGERLLWLKKIMGQYIKTKRQQMDAASSSTFTAQAASPSGSPTMKKRRIGAIGDDFLEDELA